MSMTAPRRPAVRVSRGELAGSRWEIAERDVPDRLSGIVHDWSGYSEETPGPLIRRELPGPHVVVIVELGPPLLVHDRDRARAARRHRGGFVAGLDDGATVTEHLGHQRGLQINLTPIGARRLFGIPLHELTRRVVSLPDLLPRRHARIADRLGELDTWDARFDALEDLIDELTAAPSDRARVVSWALSRIEATGGAVGMGELARQLGYSAKHVIALFHDQVGMPPKLYARLVRFSRLVQRLKTSSGQSFAELALDAGYYDQAHLVREVKAFTGTTPTEVKTALVDLTALPLEVKSVQDRLASGA